MPDIAEKVKSVFSNYTDIDENTIATFSITDEEFERHLSQNIDEVFRLIH